MVGKLKFHVKNMHVKAQQKCVKEYPFECYVCREQMKSLAEVRLHLAKEHVERMNKKCPVCRVKMSQKDLDVHLCGAESINCEYCSESFTAIMTLLKHVDDNHAENHKVYNCLDCHWYSPIKLLIDLHHPSHKDEERSFACSECPKRFFDQKNLNIHARYHRLKKSL